MPTKHITKEEVIGRIRLCKKMMEEFVGIDIERSKAFQDPAIVPMILTGDDETVNITEPEMSSDVPIGQTNLLTTSILVLIAVVAINHPDWHVTAQMPEVDAEGNPTGKMVPDPESALIWREYMRAEWDRKNWQHIALMAFLKKCICGLGCTSWGWEDSGVVWEHIQSWDYGVDPYLKDWQSPKFAYKRLRMSLVEAAERYPDARFKDLVGKAAARVKSDAQKIEVFVYYDADTEAHIEQDKWIIPGDTKKNQDNKANLYGRVPFLFIEGVPHPHKSPFPLGESVLAAGSQAELSDLSQSVSNTAKAGAGATFLDSGVLSKTQLDAIEKGEQQQFIAIKNLDTNNPPYQRMQGEELRSSVLDARQEAKDEILGMVGVSRADIGFVDDRAKFATGEAIAAQKGGARHNQNRADYEKFLNRFAERARWLVAEFGGPHLHPDTREIVASEEHVRLHEAAKRVTSVKVVEGSTTYKDPSIQQQQSMQLAKLILDSFPVLVNLASMGLMQEVPNLKKVFDRVFRAFDINQTDQMWMPFKAPQQPQQKGKSDVPYKEAPEDIKRQIEAREGLQPSQLGPAQEPPDLSHHVELEKQAREHLHQVGLKAMELRHAASLTHKNGDR